MNTNVTIQFQASELFNLIDAETSRIAAFLRLDGGVSTYDILKVHTNNKPTIETYVSEAINAVIAKFYDESKYTVSESSGTTNRYKCNSCTYIYDPEVGDPEGGVQPGTAFEDVPSEWVCPVCGSSKEDFSPETFVSKTHVLAFYLPDIEQHNIDEAKKDIKDYIVHTATGRWLLARSFADYSKVHLADAEAAFYRAIIALRSRTSPLNG